MLQANLVCDKKEYHANADMIYMVGVLTGSIIMGFISDRSVIIGLTSDRSMIKAVYQTGQ